MWVGGLERVIEVCNRIRVVKTERKLWILELALDVSSETRL